MSFFIAATGTDLRYYSYTDTALTLESVRAFNFSTDGVTEVSSFMVGSKQTFSPDNKWFYFGANRSGPVYFCRAVIDGTTIGSIAPFTSENQFDAPRVFATSADGSRLLVGTTGELVLYDTHFGDETPDLPTLLDSYGPIGIADGVWIGNDRFLIFQQGGTTRSLIVDISSDEISIIDPSRTGQGPIARIADDVVAEMGSGTIRVLSTAGNVITVLGSLEDTSDGGTSISARGNTILSGSGRYLWNGVDSITKESNHDFGALGDIVMSADGTIAARLQDLSPQTTITLYDATTDPISVEDTDTLPSAGRWLASQVFPPVSVIQISEPEVLEAFSRFGDGTNWVGFQAFDATLGDSGGWESFDAADFDDALSITDISPSSVTTGTTITITGTGFVAPAAVTVGPDKEATNVTVNSTTEIVADVPAGSGTQNVTVYIGDSAVTEIDAVTYT